jgi:hypothetical protein
MAPTVVSGRWFHSRAVLWKSVIIGCLVVHSLGDISCVCLACLVLQNLKQSATTHVLHWKKKIQCGCTCVYDLLIAFSKFLTERHVHIRLEIIHAGHSLLLFKYG